MGVGWGGGGGGGVSWLLSLTQSLDTNDRPRSLCLFYVSKIRKDVTAEPNGNKQSLTS